MSVLNTEIRVNTNTSKLTRGEGFPLENFKKRDITNVISLGTNVSRANDSCSLLGIWMREENPFSHRQLMTQVSVDTRKKISTSSLMQDLGALRTKFTPDGYANIVDVLSTISSVKQEMKEQSPLSTLTVREKNSLQENLGLYKEHFERVLYGLSHAKFHKDVESALAKVKEEVHQVLKTIQDLSSSINKEIRPSLADFRPLYV